MGMNVYLYVCMHTHVRARKCECGCSQRPGKSVGSPGFAGNFEVHEWVLEAERWSYGRAVSALKALCASPALLPIPSFICFFL